MDDQRLITQHQGLWFALLPRVVRELNAGRGVNVSQLIDRTWAQAMSQTAAEHELEMDILYVAPPIIPFGIHTHTHACTNKRCLMTDLFIQKRFWSR